MSEPLPPADEQTPVDDVRRIRERLDRDAGGDVHVLAEQSRRFAADACEKLGLRPASPAKPTPTPRVG